MILFGMLALLFIAKDRPFLAGVSSALSCLCWQPGLLFAGVAILIFSRYLTSWRDLRALKVVAGTCLPLAAMFLYFAWLGAAGELWSWTFAYTFGVYAPTGFRGLSGNALHIWNVTSRVLGPGVVFLALALMGFLALLWETFGKPGDDRMPFTARRDLYKDAIFIAPLVYALFCLIDFKSASYLIPAIPFVGIFGGVMAVKLARWLERIVRPSTSGLRLEWILVGVALVLALGSAIRSGLAPDQGLQIQEVQLRAISGLLAPNERLYVHGATEILAVLDRPNLNPYIFLDNNKDEYIAGRTPGGFQAILESMESEAPKVVVLAGMSRVAHREDIEAWVNSHYDKSPSLSQAISYDVYVRKP